MGLLRFVCSLNLQVSFAKEPCTRDYILQKRPTFENVVFHYVVFHTVNELCTRLEWLFQLRVHFFFFFKRVYFHTLNGLCIRLESPSTNYVFLVSYFHWECIFFFGRVYFHSSNELCTRLESASTAGVVWRGYFHWECIFFSFSGESIFTAQTNFAPDSRARLQLAFFGGAIFIESAFFFLFRESLFSHLKRTLHQTREPVYKLFVLAGYFHWECIFFLGKSIFTPWTNFGPEWRGRL